MAQRKQTPISGITTTSTYEDGSTYSLVNLRPKNGALHPVAPRKIEQILSRNYDIVFIHRNNDWTNWIGVVRGESSSEVYEDIRGTPSSIATVPGMVTSIQQIGNTLSLITDDGVYYLLLREGKYRFLGELPQIPEIQFKTSDEMVALTLNYFDYFPEPEVTSDGWGVGTTVHDLPEVPDYTKAMIYKVMDGIMNGYFDDDDNWVEGRGQYLFDACFIRYAFRLYDGSLTKHSSPILVMPPKNIHKIKSSTYKYGQWADNGNVQIDVTAEGYRPEVNYDFTLGDEADAWGDIIQSVDIFMSSPLGLSNIENIRKDLPYLFGGDDTRNKRYDLIEEITPAMIDAVKDTSSFYLFKSIPIGQMSDGFEDLFSGLEEVNLSTLAQREVMSDDQLSNHKIGAAASYAYNNRLHLADIKTTFFNGFSPEYLQWHGQYNGVEMPPVNTGKFIAEVELSIGGRIEKVYSVYEEHPIPELFSSAFLSYPDPRAQRITVYYEEYMLPDAWYRVFTAPLKPHAFLNLAYYLNASLEPIVRQYLGQATPVVPPTVALSEPNKLKVSELNNPLVFPVRNTYQIGDGTILSMATNVMNVSDRNYGQYPLFIFTSHGVWALNVGQGEVAYSTLSTTAHTEAPTSKIVAETPHGVVFAGRRGLMLINGRAVTFLSPQIEEAPRKLNIEGVNIEPNQHCSGVVHAQETHKFSDLLKNLKALVYDPFEDELTVVTGDGPNYVLNFPAKSFYRSTEKIDLIVGNSYPDLYVVGGEALKDFAFPNNPNNPTAHVSLITRPLTFGSRDIKRFERIVMRGLIYGAVKREGKFPLYMFHHSMDGVNFRAITGYPIPEGNGRDLDSGLLARTKTSHVLFTMAGEVGDETTIECLDTVFEDEYKNTKMR